MDSARIAESAPGNIVAETTVSANDASYTLSDRFFICISRLAQELVAQKRFDLSGTFVEIHSLNAAVNQTEKKEDFDKSRAVVMEKIDLLESKIGGMSSQEEIERIKKRLQELRDIF